MTTARMKFTRDNDPLLPGYCVEMDGKPLGWVTNMGDGWVADCKPDGCWCHMVLSDTRREAAEYLLATAEARV